ncbi:MAG: hypothetical protein FJX75_05980 [Armatimonadetes bacterium]|nr:hypothetical protein [Armatimonadota bacterium]
MNPSESTSAGTRLSVASDGDRHGLSPAAIVVGILGAAAACFVVCWAELVVKSIQIAICQFAPAAIGLLLLVVLLNAVIGRLSRRKLLKSHEIIIIYVMILVAALTTSRGLLEKLFATLVGVNYYGTEANHWQGLFFPNIPQWAVPFDVRGDIQQPVAVWFYEGTPRGAAIPWGAWATPLAMWGIMSVAVILCFACIATIFRRQWVDNEKLTFPLVNLPLEMAGATRMAGESFFRNRLTWIGFTLPTLMFMLVGLHGLYPSVPEIPTSYPLNPIFSAWGKPWRDLGYTTAYFSLAAVGFAYFLPQQLLFSLWAFYFLIRIQNIVFSALGVTPEAMPLYPTSAPNGYQVAGAYIVLTAHLIRSGLPHLKDVWARAKGLPGSVDDSQELLPYRHAAIGLAVCFVIAVLWCMQLGMAWYMAILQMGVYLFIVAIVMARSVNEAGMLMAETSFRPVNLVQLLTKRSVMGKGTLTALALTDPVFVRDLRGNLLSTFFDALKMSDSAKVKRRHLFFAVIIALVVCFAVGGYLHLKLPYTEGAVGLYSYVYWGNNLLGIRDYAPVLEVGDSYDPRLPIYFGSGVIVTIVLSVMRARYWWWPLFPIGFALSGSWSMIVFWCPILVAWIVKSVLIRYGGMHTYSRLRPLFLGLILGEFSQAVLWATIAGIWRTPAPFFPWP